MRCCCTAKTARRGGACAQHYHVLWKQAVDSKLAGFHVRAPAARPTPAQRQTLEMGMIVGERGAGKTAVTESLLQASTMRHLLDV